MELKAWQWKENLASNRLMYTPEQLANKFVEYIEWAKQNPLKKPIIDMRDGAHYEAKYIRVLTLRGFCIFMGISSNTYCNYERQLEYKDICDLIKDFIYNHKYEHAVVGIFNTLLVTRDLGISDSTIVNIADVQKRSVNELFPKIEEILAIEVKNTELSYIESINTNDETDKQELCIPGPEGEGI